MTTETFAVNTTTMGLSEYTGGFASAVALAGLDGQLYALTATDLYEHTGDDDDGESIVPTLTTGGLTLADNNEYNIPKCSFAASGAGTVSVARFTKERGQAFSPEAYTATLTTEIDQHDMPLETRQLSRTWQFTVTISAPDSGTNAGAALETFDVYVNPARHR